ncbi:hypothetical protein VHEMI03041 [[Torrubiella] hemipterigena]|uniref:YCII-related domain-containing protein n=1 Tax=[Torrubiella] hemipterigena TaxID=1531966 RepID=A0A0A1T9P4_9HYPO|nr:hypothetical protein VHEMI03041 [[Torrubiella] hemipterigena]
MPKYMILIKGNAGSESIPKKGEVSEEVAAMNNKMFNEMVTFNEKLIEAEVLVELGGFESTHAAHRMEYSATGAPQITPGPFDLEKERMPCGFWLLETKDDEEVLKWAKQIPFQQGEVIIHKLGKASEMPGFDDDLMKREEKMDAALLARRIKFQK